MNERLTEKQLLQVVAEVERLNQRRTAEYDRTQVVDILKELNLPTDLVDEALVQLERRQALELQQKRNRFIWGGAAGFAALAVAGAIFLGQQNQQKLSRVRPLDVQVNPSIVDARVRGTVVFRVTLTDAPVGEALALRCDWTDPSGTVVHQNRYRTQPIDREVWPTACRYTPTGEARTGSWKVTMSLPDRVLGSRGFEVR